MLQGERELAKDCRSLARFSIPIEPATAGFPRVDVVFMIDANGILNVTARDVRTGRERSLDVKPSYGLTDEEVERMLEESIDFAEEDVAARLLAESRTEAATLVRQIERTLVESRALLEPGEEDAIRAAIATLQTGGRRRPTTTAFAIWRRALSDVSTPFAHRIMEASIKRALEHKNGRRWTMGLKWDDAEDLAIELADEHEGVDPLDGALHRSASLRRRAVRVRRRSQGLQRGQARGDPDGLARRVSRPEGRLRRRPCRSCKSAEKSTTRSARPIYLAYQSDRRPCSVAEIAAREAIPKKFLEKIIQDLIHHGLVRSTRGAQGGYALARAPEQVTFKDVIEAIEGPVSLNVCVGDAGESSRLLHAVIPAARCCGCGGRRRSA